MSTATIGSYTAAVSLDPANDYWLIQTSGVYKKINRNTALGLSSAPVGINDSQTVANKVFSNTNTLTILDGGLTIQNSSDATKQGVFSLAGNTTGTTRTYTLPDASTTVVGTTATQTLTNKTLTSPSISGGSIDNSTVTVDSITGHTSSTTGTVYGVSVTSGVINSAAITSASIADSLITPKMLLTGTGSSWVWQSWTPTWTNVTIGNATVIAIYAQTGKSVFFTINVVFGSTSSMTGSPVKYTLPVTAVFNGASFYTNIGSGVTSVNSANTTYTVSNLQSSTTQASVYVKTVSGSYVTDSNITSTVPFTWTTGSVLTLNGIYEAA